LADCLARADDPREALKAHEAQRLPAANKVVLTNRAYPPDFINIKVEERSATGRSTTSTATSPKPSCGRSRSTTSASRGSRWGMWACGSGAAVAA
jgi:hypothetical protein